MKRPLICHLLLMSSMMIGSYSLLYAEQKTKTSIDAQKDTLETLEYNTGTTVEKGDIPTTPQFFPTQTNLSRVCFFDTRNSYPYLRVLESDRAMVTTFQLAKELETFKALQLWIHNCGEWTFTNHVFKGKRRTLIGKLLENIINPDQTYNGTICIDQYKKGFPFVLNLKSMRELSTFITYFIDSRVLPNKRKNLLFISTEEEFDINKLTPEEVDFINQYFTLEDPMDDEFESLLEARFKETINLCVTINKALGLKAIPFFGNKRATTLAMLDKEFYLFDSNIIFPKMVSYVASSYLVWLLLIKTIESNTSANFNTAFKTSLSGILQKFLFKQ